MNTSNVKFRRSKLVIMNPDEEEKEKVCGDAVWHFFLNADNINNNC